MNTKEYNRIVDQHADGLFRFILKNLKDEDNSRDVVQDTFEKLWLNHEKVEFSKAKSYLFTTGYHTMIDHIRKHKRISLVEEHQENAYYYSDHYQGARETLETALAHLPPVQKSVVMLRDYEGYSYQEIAEITNLNEGQVKVYIHRARMFLRTFIQKMEDYYREN